MKLDNIIARISHEGDKIANLYIDKCDDWDLAPSWLGKSFVNKNGNKILTLRGLLKKGGSTMVVLENPNNHRIPTEYLSVSMFLKNYELDNES